MQILLEHQVKTHTFANVGCSYLANGENSYWWNFDNILAVTQTRYPSITNGIVVSGWLWKKLRTGGEEESVTGIPKNL